MQTGARNDHHNNEGRVIFNDEQLDERVADGDAGAAAAVDRAQNVPQGGAFGRGGLGAAHQALLQREGPAGYQPYLRPDYFPIRIVMLFVIMCVSLSIASTVFLTLPGIVINTTPIAFYPSRHLHGRFLFDYGIRISTSFYYGVSI